MPYQGYCHNTERVALQRRLPSDDQWVKSCKLSINNINHIQHKKNTHNYKVNPHNPCLAVYATGSCHVLPFDPRFGGDTCRTYASKYAAKVRIL